MFNYPIEYQKDLLDKYVKIRWAKHFLELIKSINY